MSYAGDGEVAPVRGRSRWFRLLAAGVGLLVGLALGWALLPPAPGFVRRPVPAIPSRGDLLFSPDGRLLATHEYVMEGLHEDRGRFRLWEVATARELFSIPHDRIFTPACSPGHSTAFSADGRQFIVAGFGRAAVWETESGKNVGSAHDMKPELIKGQSCRLAADAAGRPLWLWSEPGRCRFHDLGTGREIGTVDGPANLDSSSKNFRGFLLAASKGGCQLWEVPGGKLRLSVSLPPGNRTPFWTLSGDGGTLALVDGENRVWDPAGGAMRTLGLAGDEWPSLSPDGRQLAVLVHDSGVSVVVPSWLWEQLGLPADSEGNSSRVNVYDVDSRKEITHFAGAHSAIFAPDGRTLAVVQDHDIVLFEPKEVRPWDLIVGVAACSGLAGFLLAG